MRQKKVKIKSFFSRSVPLAALAVIMALAVPATGCKDSSEKDGQPTKEITKSGGEKPGPIKTKKDNTAEPASKVKDQKAKGDKTAGKTAGTDSSQLYMQDLPPVPVKPALQKSAELFLVYTTDISGEIEHCGCPGHPRGGLARRVEHVRKLMEKGPVLQVDAGNLFFPYRGNRPRITDKHKAHARLLAKGVSRVGVHAVNVGYQDVQASPEFLKKLARPEDMDPIPLVCANLYNTEPPKRVFSPYQVVRIKGVQVGILGMMGPGDLYRNKELEIKDPVEVASALVPYLKEKCDLVILLYAGSFKDLNQLVRHVKGVDIAVVSSRSSRLTRRPFIAGETLVLQAGNRGMYLGKMDLTVKKEAKQKLSEKKRAMLQEKLDRLRTQKKLLTGPALRDRELRKEQSSVTRQISAITRQLSSSISRLDYKNHIVSMDLDLPRDEKTVEWMKQVKK